jgi:hypothetical protein
MYAASSRLFRPGRSRWPSAVIVLVLVATTVALLVFAASLAGAAGGSTPAEMVELLGPFRWPASGSLA